MLYSLERRAGYNPLTEYWVPLAYCDAALLHAILACADSFIVRSSDPRTRPTAIKHFTSAIRILNDSFAQKPLIVSDEAVAVVCTMAIIEVVFFCVHTHTHTKN